VGAGHGACRLTKAVAAQGSECCRHSQRFRLSLLTNYTLADCAGLPASFKNEERKPNSKRRDIEEPHLGALTYR
jgi:hypothetical protein